MKRSEEKRMIVSSECGVLKLPAESIVEKGRLSPGKMLWADFAKGTLTKALKRALKALNGSEIARRRAKWEVEGLGKAKRMDLELFLCTSEHVEGKEMGLKGKKRC